jgi:hypothetical protein
VVQRRTMSHPDMGVVVATTDSFILFENGVMRNQLVLPGLSNAASHASKPDMPAAPRASWESHLARPATEPMNNSINGCADLSFAPRLACFRWHDDGASVGVMIVGERSLPDAITSHSAIK